MVPRGDGRLKPGYRFFVPEMRGTVLEGAQ
jgi:hypothetical protein